MSEIKPCPFCGSDDVEVFVSNMCRYDDYSVLCGDCEAEGPFFKEDRAAAIVMWNMVSDQMKESKNA